ncbi:cyclin-like protein [Emericellopsis atlantica]|uniref:Cyclin-like protein n=1 Tax=Emericellopsis atlantica TaxID=2614577 RepID=A0A9P7ZNC1_9HYPO|nr:cyclin-like protein [Emericellopsis atlantica]KAG9255293.1 cyclin-like protein [Emericellopsis atlantica]
MNAQPCRPRGGENAKPALHQKHKSTGNLQTNASMAGVRAPAKRAAFADLTNIAKHNNNGTKDGAKIHKAKSMYLGHGKNGDYVKPQSITIRKENVPSTRVSYPPKPAPQPAAAPQLKTFNVAQKTKQPALVEAKIDEEPLQEEEPHAVVQVKDASSHPLQPRHHKSQPQLKQEQPALRRTQSRQLERTESVETIDDTVDLVPIEMMERDTLADMLAEGPVQQAVDGIYETARMPEEPQVERLSRLSEIIEGDGVLSAIHNTDGPTPGLSEPEEWWDEEDEEYEDADQGYTTARSVQPGDFTHGGMTTLLQPKVTTRIQREMEEARIFVESTRAPEDVEDEAWDVSMVAEYGDDIFAYMRKLEASMLPNPHYIEFQTEIQWSMRAVLMEWLVQVHQRFTLLPETLFLTVNYIDRFLSAKVVSIGKLQLVGATALLVASKYEEINCPSLSELVYMVEEGYSAEEIIKAERFMLSMLNFELGWPGPMSFLRRVSKADDYDLDTRTLAKYFLELTIVDERFVASPPSFLAAGAHCLARLVLNKGDWGLAHVHYSGYTYGQLQPLVVMLIECCEIAMDHHSVIFEKYTDPRFKKCSILVQKVLDSGFALPHHSMPVRKRLQTQAFFEESHPCFPRQI